MMSLTLRTDVTSVKIHKIHIFAGIGSWLNIFNKKTGQLTLRLNCLVGQKIYGIIPSSSGRKILVFGGKQFTILSYSVENDTEIVTNLVNPVVCDDWLHSGLWMDEENITLLTAHNVVQKYNTTDHMVTAQHCSTDNSILYCGLLLNVDQEVLVFAGTVFSEVIIHVYGNDVPIHHLVGHKGVIFSISCDIKNGRIVTTSDDRSVRIWEPNNISDYPSNSINFWKNIEFVCKHELYGHSARVMRCCITNDKVISVGEDSAICFWNFDGSLAKKILTHQNGCIWAVDADSDLLVTGGGDCAVISHPLTLATDYSKKETLNLEVDSPKKVLFTARRNIILLNETNDLLYFNVEEKSKAIFKLSHDTTCKLVSVSSCRQMIAVADMNGKLDVFAETCKDTASLVNIVDTKLSVNKILSMQWAGNRHIVICTDNGEISILASKDSNTEPYANFTLPSCKERWLTASAIDHANNILVLGDRCGNIHIFAKGQKSPIKSFNKVHGRYGPTSITIKNNDVITTGRDGTIKYFSMNKANFILMSTKELDFKWVEKFLDKEENVVCGFQERVFVVTNIKTNCKLLEVSCGGGHRSWDAIRYIEKADNNYEEFIKLVYLKNSDINIVKFQLNKIVSKNFINGSHSKEINCLKTLHFNDKSITFYISGGEDTTLRISSTNKALEFEDKVIFKQLSSIRTIKICRLNDNKVLLISAGGRAQICIKVISFLEMDDEIKVKCCEMINYMIKGTDKTRKVNQHWRNSAVDFDPETRIMDVDYTKAGETLTVFAGCSDASLRIFSLKNIDNEANFLFINELKYHKTCILKTTCIKSEIKDILVTCATRGDVAFWDTVDVIRENAEPFFVLQTNKSGINSIAYKSISSNLLTIATGGDDNAIHLVLLEISNQNNLICGKVLHSKVLNEYHCSEITGLCLVDNLMVSTSIDQRVSLFEWELMGDKLECIFLSQTYSDVADIQDMDVIKYNGSTITVCVFGKGMEVIQIPVQKK